jgi:hypothetical protein
MTQEVQETEVNPLVSDEVKQPEKNTPEATAAPGDVEKPKQEEQPAKTFTQAEVDAIVQKRIAKEERKIERKIAETLREQTTAVAPKRETFGSDEEFSQAEIDHKAEVKARELVQQRERQTQAEKQREAFEERTEKVLDRYPDFDAVVKNPTLRINEAMADFIEDSEQGPDLAYYLGKHPGKAAEIFQMPPMRAARELVRLETELAAKPKATPSKAPEPISPVGTRGKASSSSMPSDDDPIDVWMKKENDRMRKPR